MLRTMTVTEPAPGLLNFDEAGFLAVQAGAVALAPAIDAAVGAAIAAGAPNIFLLGTGGAALLLGPAARLLRARSTLPVFDDLTAELLIAGSPHLLKGSIVVIPSQSGTTAESVAMLDLAQSRGARVLALVGEADSPLGRRADHVVVNPSSDATSSESFYIQGLLVALAVLRHRGEIGEGDRLVAGLADLPHHLLRMKTAMETRAPGVALRLADHGYHIVTASGNTWPEAVSYAMCVLEEMQWIRARPVHASDFFHGTLETVEPGVSVLLFKGEDEMRPLAERVERFVPRVGGTLTVVDTADFASPGLMPELRALLSPAILTTLLERVSAHLEVLRDHPLTQRRYFRRMAY